MGRRKLPVPTDYRHFKFRGKEFIHIESGWCVREMTKGCWRMFYGVLRPGTEYPVYVSVHAIDDGPCDFDEFADAVRWVEARRSQPGA